MTNCDELLQNLPKYTAKANKARDNAANIICADADILNAEYDRRINALIELERDAFMAGAEWVIDFFTEKENEHDDKGI